MMTLASDFAEIINTKNFLLLFMFSIGGSIAIISIIASTVRAISIGRARERTKRELAAYVAEGSLDPDKAVAMINAGRPHWETGHGPEPSGHKGSCCA